MVVGVGIVGQVLHVDAEADLGREVAHHLDAGQRLVHGPRITDVPDEQSR